MSLFDPHEATPGDVSEVLAKHHYLGATRRGVAYRDGLGVMVFASPTSRRLPATWLDLTRWCITSRAPNTGTQQWSSAHRWLVGRFPSCTTVVSYSDPAAGHTGALYRACNWLWAPTWHRLRLPPSGNGAWQVGKAQSVKDRWVFLLRPDSCREEVLRVNDGGLLRRFPWASYTEPRWRKARPRQEGGGDYRRFVAIDAAKMGGE